MVTHLVFSGNCLEIADIFLRFYVASREIDKNVLFFGHKRTFLENRSIDFICKKKKKKKKSNLFSPVVLVSRYTKQILDYPISSMVLLSEQR